MGCIISVLNFRKVKVENQRKRDNLKKEIGQFSACKDSESLRQMILNSNFKMDNLMKYFDEQEAKKRKLEEELLEE